MNARSERERSKEWNRYAGIDSCSKVWPSRSLLASASEDDERRTCRLPQFITLRPQPKNPRAKRPFRNRGVHVVTSGFAARTALKYGATKDEALPGLSRALHVTACPEGLFQSGFAGGFFPPVGITIGSREATRRPAGWLVPAGRRVRDWGWGVWISLARRPGVGRSRRSCRLVFRRRLPRRGCR